MYRQSIASLRYIAQSDDPKLLSDFARVVMDDEDEDTPTEEEEDEEMDNMRTPRRKMSKQKGVSDICGNEDKENAGIHSGTDDRSAHGDVSSEDENDEHLLPGFTHVGGPLNRKGKMRSGTLETTASSQSHTQSESGRSLLAEEAIGGLVRKDSLARDRFMVAAYGNKTKRVGRESAMSAQTHLSMQSSADSAYNPLSPTSDNNLLGGSTFGRYRARGPLAGGATQQNGSTNMANNDNAVQGYAINSANASTRTSMESVRLHFRRAHKLARVFGTTKGEIFNSVLDAIEADIAELDEDEELDEEERRDVLEGVAALRASL